mmetsp:Transcript_37515/g.91175  ORF Transcript_37515/g.91175 Transcript_37515/m.91175 type:complete len:258 (-) Transcript_37515:1715-2488(-)
MYPTPPTDAMYCACTSTVPVAAPEKSEEREVSDEVTAVRYWGETPEVAVSSEVSVTLAPDEQSEAAHDPAHPLCVQEETLTAAVMGTCPCVAHDSANEYPSPLRSTAGCTLKTIPAPTPSGVPVTPSPPVRRSTPSPPGLCTTVISKGRIISEFTVSEALGTLCCPYVLECTDDGAAAVADEGFRVNCSLYPAPTTYFACRLAKVATPATTSAVVAAEVLVRVFFHTPSAIVLSLLPQTPPLVAHAACDTAEHGVVV